MTTTAPLVSQSVDVYETDDPIEFSTHAETVRVATPNVTVDFGRDEDLERLEITTFVNAEVPAGAEPGDLIEVIGYLAVADSAHARAIVAHLTATFDLES